MLFSTCGQRALRCSAGRRHPRALGRARRRATWSALLNPREQHAMLAIVGRVVDRFGRELLGFIEPTEPRVAVRERSADLVLLRLKLVRELQVLDRQLRVADAHVDEMTEVVVVPRIAWRDLNRAAVRRARRAEVAEQRLAQAHQRVHAVVA